MKKELSFVRKIFFLCCLAVSSLTAHSQVYKFRCFEDKLVFKDNSKAPMDWQPVDILVVINADKDLIRIFANKESNIDIISHSPLTENEDGSKEVNYTGVDENGIRCSVYWVTYADKTKRHVATLMVDYKDVIYAYRLKFN